MKTCIILVGLLSAPLAHADAESIVLHSRAAEPVAFYDIQKAMAGSADGKKNAASEKADLDKKQAEVTAAQEAAKKASSACDKTVTVAIVGRTKECIDADKKNATVADLRQRYQQELTQRQQANAQALLARINRILPAIAKAKHLGAILPAGGAFYAGPALDVTAEVIRRLDTGEGAEVATKDDEIAKLRAELASLQAERAALTKPAPPSVPPPPPTQPLAAKAK